MLRLTEVNEMKSRVWALFCSVLHYGMGNLASGSKPPRPDTVVTAAAVFDEYLRDGVTPPGDDETAFKHPDTT